MSNNILIHKENDFSSRDISSIPLGNNIIINNTILYSLLHVCFWYLRSVFPRSNKANW